MFSILINFSTLSGSRQINDYLQSSSKMDLAQLPDSTYKMKTVDQRQIIKERKEYWERLFAKVIYIQLHDIYDNA